MTEQETPIMGYIARLQHQMEYVTTLIFNERTSKGAIKTALRGLIANFPPNGKKELEPLYNKMLSDGILTDKEAEDLYNQLHDWAYDAIFQDAFRAKPKYVKKGHLGSEAPA